MRYIFAALAVVLSASVSLGDDVIHVAKDAPFENPNAIAAAVREECDLPRKQMELLIAAASERGITLVVDDENPPSEGKVLVLQIARADSIGRAGANYHAKSVALRGKLMQNGQQVGSFVGMRNSTGQAFGVLKSSCTVLELCLKKLASDVAVWLQKPTLNARIGE